MGDMEEEEELTVEKEPYFSGVFYLDNVTTIEEYTQSIQRAEPLKMQQRGYLKKLNKFAYNSKEFPNFIKIIPRSERIRTASCGSNMVALVTQKGKVYTWGPENINKACLGKEDVKTLEIPIFKGTNPGNKVAGISCGPFHMIAYTFDNKVYTWG